MYRHPISNPRPILKSASNSQIYGRFSLSQIDIHWHVLEMTPHPLGQVFEAMTEKDKTRFQMRDSWWQKKVCVVFIVTVDKISLCLFEPYWLVWEIILMPFNVLLDFVFKLVRIRGSLMSFFADETRVRCTECLPGTLMFCIYLI